ncbi:Ceramide synthase 4 [Cucumispora dikerogammari]|nr:Ceramide synthase 4 [Cucumispora dikerogammari]
MFFTSYLSLLSSSILHNNKCIVTLSVSVVLAVVILSYYITFCINKSYNNDNNKILFPTIFKIIMYSITTVFGVITLFCYYNDAEKNINIYRHSEKTKSSNSSSTLLQTPIFNKDTYSGEEHVGSEAKVKFNNDKSVDISRRKSKYRFSSGNGDRLNVLSSLSESSCSHETRTAPQIDPQISSHEKQHLLQTSLDDIRTEKAKTADNSNVALSLKYKISIATVSSKFLAACPPSTIRKYHYSLAITMYVFQLFLLQTNTPAKDYTIMFIHHIITLLLLIGSLKSNLTIIGSHILILHDVSDPLLELSKLFHKLKYKTSANIVFTIFSLIFCIARIILFPVYCVYPTLIEGFYNPRCLFFIQHFNNTQYNNKYSIKVLGVCLIVLFILNCIWFGFILRLLKKILYNERVYDITKED